jgi:hypothetical protein
VSLVAVGPGWESGAHPRQRYLGNIFPAWPRTPPMVSTNVLDPYGPSQHAPTIRSRLFPFPHEYFNIRPIFNGLPVLLWTFKTDRRKKGRRQKFRQHASRTRKSGTSTLLFSLYLFPRETLEPLSSDTLSQVSFVPFKMSFL